MKKVAFITFITIALLSVVSCGKHEPPENVPQLPELDSYVGLVRANYPGVNIPGVSINGVIVEDIKVVFAELRGDDFRDNVSNDATGKFSITFALSNKTEQEPLNPNSPIYGEVENLIGSLYWQYVDAYRSIQLEAKGPIKESILAKIDEVLGKSSNNVSRCEALDLWYKLPADYAPAGMQTRWEGECGINIKITLKTGDTVEVVYYGKTIFYEVVQMD